MKKRRITDFASGIVLGAVLFSGIAYADSDAIKLIVNGKQVQSDVSPVVIDGHTMVPIRTVAESLGLDIKWDGNNRAVVINGSGNGTSSVGNTPTDLPSSRDQLISVLKSYKKYSGQITWDNVNNPDKKNEPITIQFTTFDSGHNYVTGNVIYPKSNQTFQFDGYLNDDNGVKISYFYAYPNIRFDIKFSLDQQNNQLVGTFDNEQGGTGPISLNLN